MKTFFHVHKKRIFWADLFQISETTPLDDPVKMTQFPPASLRFKPGDYAVAVGAEAVRLIWRHRESLAAEKIFAFRDPPTQVAPMQAIKRGTPRESADPRRPQDAEAAILPNAT